MMGGSSWPGFGDGRLLLPLPRAWFTPMATTLDVYEACLQIKHEFHVTLLDRSSGALARDTLGPARVRELFEEQDWHPAHTGNGVVLRKPKQRAGSGQVCYSIIELVELPALQRFRAALSRAGGFALAEAPAHVTLYTSGDTRGIGLPDQQALTDASVSGFRLPGIANRPPPPLDDAQRAAYCAADYALDELGTTVRIGECCAPVDAALIRRSLDRAMIVTAYNPFSSQASDAGNTLRQQCLLACLHGEGLEVVAAEGRDPQGQWPSEPSVLVFGTTPELETRVLRDFEQHAIVALQRGAPAHLVVHPDAPASGPHRHVP